MEDKSKPFDPDLLKRMMMGDFDPNTNEDWSPSKKASRSNFSKNKVPLPSIDLHIQVLNPNLKEASALEIFDYQMEACRVFLRDSKAQGIKKIKVIHGVGSGKLADAVSRIAKEEFRASMVSRHTKKKLRSGETVIVF
ncbi:MAG: Smr/MutS family protein [Chitinophagales bacterium]